MLWPLLHELRIFFILKLSDPDGNLIHLGPELKRRSRLTYADESVVNELSNLSLKVSILISIEALPTSSCLLLAHQRVPSSGSHVSLGATSFLWCLLAATWGVKRKSAGPRRPVRRWRAEQVKDARLQYRLGRTEGCSSLLGPLCDFTGLAIVQISHGDSLLDSLVGGRSFAHGFLWGALRPF